jgi:undecaprenyl-diphosphatase
MMAATVYALWKDRALLNADDLGMIAIGFATALVVALLVVKAFVAIVSKYGFAPFAYYRIIIGAAALVWLNLR